MVLQEAKKISASSFAKEKTKKTSHLFITQQYLSASYLMYLYNRPVRGADVILLHKLGTEVQTYFSVLRNLAEKKVIKKKCSATELFYHCPEIVYIAHDVLYSTSCKRNHHVSNTVTLAELFRKTLKYLHPKRMQHILDAT